MIPFGKNKPVGIKGDGNLLEGRRFIHFYLIVRSIKDILIAQSLQGVTSNFFVAILIYLVENERNVD